MLHEPRQIGGNEYSAAVGKPETPTHLPLGTMTDAGRIAAQLLTIQHGPQPGIDALQAAEPGVGGHQRKARQLGAVAARRLAAGKAGEAIALLQQIVRLQPQDSAAHHSLARALDSAGQAPAAIDAYKRAIELQPDRISAIVRLAELQLLAGSRAAAEASFRAAAAAMAGTDAGRVNAARAAILAGAYDEAETELRAVIAGDAENGEALATLGKLLADTGRLDEAAASYERAAGLDRNLAVAWYGYALNRRFSPADLPLIARIRACLDRKNLPPDHRMALHFALGKALDDVGDYAEAARHFEIANRADQAAHKLDRSSLARRIDRIIAGSPAGFLDRRPDFATHDETPVLIVGMPRSGTTLVEQILSSHPAVAAGGELTYWGDTGYDLLDGNARTETARRLSGDYLAILRRIAPQAARVTDKLPFNYQRLGLIRQVLPQAYVVHCRRNPVDTCWSIYTTYFRSRLADRGDLVFFYRQYERLMAHWRQVLPAGRFLEIDYEALVTDPEPVTRQLIAFCGLEWHEACLAPHRNSRPVTTASVWQARQPIHRGSVARWRHYEPWLGELRTLLPDADAAPH